MTMLFSLKRQKEETWVEYHTRTCNMARKMWVQMDLPFLNAKIAEGMWRAMGGYAMKRRTWEEYEMVAIPTNKKMKEDPENRIRWKRKWRWHNRGNVWDKIATGQIHHLHPEHDEPLNVEKQERKMKQRC